MEISVAVTVPPELEPKKFLNKYHGTEIEILEIEHQDKRLQPNMDVEFQRPSDWRDVIRNKIGKQTVTAIFPEYCMPDLEQNVFKELGTGLASREAAKTLGISDFHSFISTCAGMNGKTQVATDIANTNWYQLFEIVSSLKVDAEQMTREQAPNITSALGLNKFEYQLGKIAPGEYQMHTSNDARHLISARGIMQYSIVNKPTSIVSIWAPRHAERVDDYIKRQTVWESGSTVKIEVPSDFKYVTPQEEKRKMKVYGRPPLHRTIREYKPIFSPLAYEIHQIAIRQSSDDFKQLEDQIEKYLGQSVDQNELEQQARAKIALERIKQGDGRTLSLLNTDKSGWKLTRKAYIY